MPVNLPYVHASRANLKTDSGRDADGDDSGRTWM